MGTHLSTQELTELRADTQRTFNDSCKLGTATPGGGTGPEADDDTITYGAEIDCGFVFGGGSESGDGAQLDMNAATIRFPLASAVVGVDRVQVTKRDGTALSPVEYYSIVGKPKKGKSAIVLDCQVLKGGSGA